MGWDPALSKKGGNTTGRGGRNVPYSLLLDGEGNVSNSLKFMTS